MWISLRVTNNYTQLQIFDFGENIFERDADDYPLYLHFNGPVWSWIVYLGHPKEQATFTYCCICCCQFSPDADGGTSPSKDDSSRAKKSLFKETVEPSADTTSGSDSEQVKMDAADDGTRDDSGKPVVTTLV